MGIYLNPGNEGFRKAVNSQIYVDKSGLIGRVQQVQHTRIGIVRTAQNALAVRLLWCNVHDPAGLVISKVNSIIRCPVSVDVWMI